MDQSGFAGRYKVGTRIYTGFVIVLFLLVAVAAIGYRGLAGADSSFKIYADAAGDAVFAQTVQSNVANLRRTVVIYTERGEGEDKVRDSIKALKPMLAKMREGANTAAQRTDSEKMIALFDSYTAGFDKLAQLRVKRDGLVNDKLFPSGAHMREVLSDVIANAFKDGKFENSARAGMAQEQLLLNRISVNRFLAAPNTKYIEEVRGRAGKFIDRMNDLLPLLTIPANIDRAKQIIEESKAYVTLFEEIAGLTTEIDELVFKTMAGKAREFGDLGAAYSGDLTTNQGELEKQSGESISRSISLALIFSGLAVLIGVFFAWFIARSIIRPVEGVRKVMAELAEGQLEVKVPYIDSADELGDMARTVDALKVVSVEAVRAGCGLDRVAANVMMADTHGNITYINPSATAMFKNAEADIRKVLPAFDHTKLLGRSFDEFHANPAHQRRLTAELSTTHAYRVNAHTH
ncbi:MAG: HAMP domain-containing protein [Rhodospirillaceae bacterium]